MTKRSKSPSITILCCCPDPIRPPPRPVCTITMDLLNDYQKFTTSYARVHAYKNTRESLGISMTFRTSVDITTCNEPVP